MALPYQPDHQIMEKTDNQTNENFINPLQDGKESVAAPCLLVIFGASGDLTSRKLIPALFNLRKDGQLPSSFACVGFARRGKNHEEFRQELKGKIEQFSRTKPSDDQEIDSFLDMIYYHSSNFDDDKGYEDLDLFLKDLDKKYGTKGNRIYYLSVQPSFFLPIIEKLHAHNLVYNKETKEKFSRVIIEKPFGHNIESASSLQNSLTKFLSEEQIYRIDHYLGKETVQNLLVFRFSNTIFEGLWNNRYIDNIQITVSESIGIEGRGGFYEEQGLLRDIIQNHLMQLLSLVAMEPPINLSPNSIRDEKVKVLQAIRSFPEKALMEDIVRGQYINGFIEGDDATAYRNEDKVAKSSQIETFCAMKLFVENWRWAGVPFYIRAGKRLPKRCTEIAVTFKKVPNILFHKHDKHNTPNCIIFRIQPNEGTSIKFNSKIPGGANIIQPVTMDFQYASYFGKEVPEAYERLIYDCILGDSTLFARFDESYNSWKLLTQVLNSWKNNPLTNANFYQCGTWGPQASDQLLAKDGRSWKTL